MDLPKQSQRVPRAFVGVYGVILVFSASRWLRTGWRPGALLLLRSVYLTGQSWQGAQVPSHKPIDSPNVPS
jgi:hypothetical protein